MSGGLYNLTHAHVVFARACGALREACDSLAKAALHASVARSDAELRLYDRVPLQAFDRVRNAREDVETERVWLGIALDADANGKQEAEGVAQ